MTHFINGQWLQGEGEAFQSLRPYDGSTAWQGCAASEAQVLTAVDAARSAWMKWRLLSYSEREAYILSFADVVKAHAEEIAETISQETGKPLWESRTEAAAVAGKIAISIRAYQTRTGETRKSMADQDVVLRHRPLGVMAVFGPYNFPCHLPNGHIVPALLAGNTIVFKPSEQTPLSGELMVKLWQEAGLPKGVINLVQGAKETGIALSQAKAIDGLLFTGSASTGHLLHTQFAGQPDKMLALEMGGNNPLVVSQASDDVDAIVYTIIQSAFLSAGQRCTCARRLYLPQGEMGDAIVAKLAKVIGDIVIDQPFADVQPFMGALISPQAVQQVLDRQRELESLGAKVLVEAKASGYAFVSPALVDVTGIEAPDEEVFGPLLQVARFNDFEQAVEWANDTRYGLSAGLISTDDKEWDYFVQHIRAGVVNRNRQMTGASGEAPFGGPGASGNFRPSAFYAADYCAYPMASMEGQHVMLPDSLAPGITI